MYQQGPEVGILVLADAQQSALIAATVLTSRQTDGGSHLSAFPEV
jgi:hypothetical protein